MERDIVALEVTIKFIYFNSHAHVERDYHADYVSEVAKISTHTLTWSVTDLTVNTVRTLDISTHTLTWSVTNNLLKIN